MDRISFDRVADVYDATRALPDWVTQAVSARLAEEVTPVPGARLLELGVGTGRIAVPLLRRGVSLVGVDISALMLARLRAKLSEVGRSGADDTGSERLNTGAPERPGVCHLVLGDASYLPFRDRAFDFVLGVHVFHLLPDLHGALGEIRRVLSGRGTLLVAGDLGGSNVLRSRVRTHWAELLAASGYPLNPRRLAEEELRRRARQCEEIAAWQWEVQIPVTQSLGRIEERHFSETWAVPDELHCRTVEELRAWIAAELGVDAVETLPREFRIARLKLEE